MITALVSWIMAFATAILPRNDKRLMFLPMFAATSLFVVAAAWTIYDPAYEYIANKDRSVYEALYDRLQWSDFSFEFEPAYTALQMAANSLGLSSSAFLTLVSLFFLASLTIFLRKRYAATSVFFFLFLSLNFFPFMQGGLNVTRQFVAAGVLLFAFPYFERAASSKAIDWRSHAFLLLIVLVAASFHRSALLNLLPFALVALGLRVPHLLAVALALLMINFAGYGPALWEPLISWDRNVSENVWSFERGEIGLMYLGGVNRIDFVAFSLAPILAHLGLRHVLGIRDARAEPLILFYFCLVFPLFLLSFVPYSDRLALFGWLIWPIALCDSAVRTDQPGARVFVLGATLAVGVIAVFNLYGLTTTEIVQAELP